MPNGEKNWWEQAYERGGLGGYFGWDWPFTSLSEMRAGLGELPEAWRQMHRMGGLWGYFGGRAREPAPPKYPEPTSTMPEGLPPGWEFPGYEPLPEDEFTPGYYALGGPTSVEMENLIRQLVFYGGLYGEDVEQIRLEAQSKSLQELQEVIREIQVQIPTLGPGQPLPPRGQLYRMPDNERLFRSVGPTGYEDLGVGQAGWSAFRDRGESPMPTEYQLNWPKWYEEQQAARQAQSQRLGEAAWYAKAYPELYRKFGEEMWQGMGNLAFDPGAGAMNPMYAFGSWLQQKIPYGVFAGKGGKPDVEKVVFEREQAGYKEYPSIYPQYQQYLAQVGLKGTTKTFQEWMETTPWVGAHLELEKEAEEERKTALWERMRRAEMATKGRWEIPRQW